MSPEAKALLVKARLDPTVTIGETWCAVPHPLEKGFQCSRPKGHPGLHLAQYDVYDDYRNELSGAICPISPNPWERTDE